VKNTREGEIPAKQIHYFKYGVTYTQVFIKRIREMVRSGNPCVSMWRNN